MALSNRDRVGQGLDQLAKGLAPFVDESRARLRAARGMRRPLLKVITATTSSRTSCPRPRPFAASCTAPRAVRRPANTAFNEADTLRTLDTAVRLLRAVGAVPEAAAVDDALLNSTQLAPNGAAARWSGPASSCPAWRASGLKPWREVIRPHRDIIAGNFNASQFAANLYNVVIGKATREYLDPAEFFHRTYLTEGLKDLLDRAIRRISGDANASPIINLQTNFGGGKTHSMLALYHIFSATPTAEYPQEMQELADGADLRELGRRVTRVVISGQDLSPQLARRRTTARLSRPSGARSPGSWAVARRTTGWPERTRREPTRA